jgi:hypothetical protein
MSIDDIASKDEDSNSSLSSSTTATTNKKIKLRNQRNDSVDSHQIVNKLNDTKINNNVDLNSTPDDLESDLSFDQCSVIGCDSSGHLNGIFNRHSSYDFCPIYFGMTKKECSMRSSQLNGNKKESKILKFTPQVNTTLNENKKTLRSRVGSFLIFNLFFIQFYIYSINTFLSIKMKNRKI